MSETLQILVLNGPNLQLLGTRKPDVYGVQTLADVEKRLANAAADLGVHIECRQSNHEGDLVDWIGCARGAYSGLLINAGAYSHTSVAIRDAVEASDLPAVEVHISNVYARESFRHHSWLSAVCIGQVCGFGIAGYQWGLYALVGYLKEKNA